MKKLVMVGLLLSFSALADSVNVGDLLAKKYALQDQQREQIDAESQQAQQNAQIQQLKVQQQQIQAQQMMQQQEQRAAEIRNQYRQ